MEKLIWSVIIIAIIAVAIRLLGKKEQAEEKNYAYAKKEFLLNIPERKFFESLQRLLPDQYTCFPQVVMSNILSVKKSERKEYLKNRSKINKKTIDFVIFQKPYLQPVLAIEYDGSSHDGPDRQKRDLFVNEVMRNSNLDIVHIKHGQVDIENIINNEIIAKLRPTPDIRVVS